LPDDVRAFYLKKLPVSRQTSLRLLSGQPR